MLAFAGMVLSSPFVSLPFSCIANARRLELELQQKQKLMASLIEQSNSAYQDRDQAKEEMRRIQIEAARKQADFEAEWKKLGEAIEADKKMKDFMKKTSTQDLADHRGNMTIDEETSLKKKIAKGAWFIGKDRAQIMLSQDKVQSYEEA